MIYFIGTYDKLDYQCFFDGKGSKNGWRKEKQCKAFTAFYYFFAHFLPYVFVLFRHDLFY